MACVTAALGCPNELPDATDAEALVILDDRAQWTQILTPEQDPFLDHRPPDVGCIEATWIAEAGGLELSTALCDYIALQQPSLVALRAGDIIHLEVFHFDLTSPEPTEGHWALVIGDEVLWSRAPAIPGAAAYYSEEVVIQQDHPTGSPVIIHLHNHGQNTYGLQVLERRGA